MKCDARYQPCAELSTKNSSSWQLVRLLKNNQLHRSLFGVPAYANSSNFGKLQFHIQHAALPSPTHREFLNYFLIIFQFFNSRVHFRDLYHKHQIQICRKITLYFLVLMQISRSRMSSIKTRLSNKFWGWKFIADINRRYDLK